MSQVALRVRVTGRVQGVFFRAWTQEKAAALGVRGWVRNAADGSVEAHLEGDKSAVRELIELLNDGPPSAQVSKVEVQVSDADGADRFEVRY